MTTEQDPGLLTGERFGDPQADARYIKHPTDGWLTDGDPLDAGSAQTLDNNLSHLSYESCRQLCVVKGPGANPTGAKDPNGYEDLTDVRPPQTVTGGQRIAWDPSTSTYCGTFPMILDGEDLGGRGASLRWVRVQIRYNAFSGVSLTLYTALTLDGENPWAHNTLAGPALFGSAGANLGTLDIGLSRMLAAGSGVPWQCRPSGELGYESMVVPVSLWVGWYAGNAADAIYTISAYECRTRET